jgi:excisionase family DNA binding protein
MDSREIVRLRSTEEDTEEITLPANLARLVRDVLAYVAQGQPVTVLPVLAELTTNQAADLLGVSRPHLIKLLETGEIAFRQVGTKRRVPVSDLLRYREENKARRLQTLAALQADAQELGMGY